MLMPEENELLTRVGPGTRMGNLLRRYWQPVAGLSEMEKRWTLKVRIFGEDLVLFKTRKGDFGLIAEACPHRAASLAYGIPTDDGFVSQLRRQMSHFSPIAAELIEVFTKHRGRTTAREPAPAAE
jgi:hypothetical protein